MVMRQADNKLDERAETNQMPEGRLARELAEIVSDNEQVSQPGETKAAHWSYSVPAPGVKYYTDG